ncbi:tetratricopeptide repeat protein [Sphingopyxis solisilvae]|uniref:tetratricopeptide repeat protein n=1 Tax=Sphingopyxis solisilvae TaxID=1886788 RepID=UPI001892ABA8|nr:tetratricopeptide repeat protein [Sphingopyxis solisilvae]
MQRRTMSWVALGAIALAGCSFGPQLRTALPTVRSVPVLAGLSPTESLARARSYLGSKQYGLAIELFRAAGKDPALELDSLNGLAIAYDAIGRADLAETYFEKALALRSDDPRTRRNLAAFYQASGQPAKREALLADIPMPRNAATVAAATGDDDGAPLLSISFAASDARQPVGAELRALSPLGGAFRPLLVKAGFSAPVAAQSAVGGDDASVICLADPASSATAPTGEGVAIFRLSIGEVFVASQPAGTSCSLAVAMPAGLKPETMSNRDYLGLVAAYLDQLNRAYHMAELTLSAKPAAI